MTGTMQLAVTVPQGVVAGQMLMINTPAGMAQVSAEIILINPDFEPVSEPIVFVSMSSIRNWYQT